MLLITLCMALAVSLFITAGTSSASFSAYNTQWDGTAEVKATANENGAETLIAQNTSRYAQLAPNRTLAVVFSPTKEYDNKDTDQIQSFVRSGGTLLVAEDYSDGGNELLSAVGANARVSGHPLRDERRIGPSPAFPRGIPVNNNTYTVGINSIMLNHGSSVTPESATTLVRSSEFSYLDRNQNEELDDEEELSTYPIVTVEEVGAGTVVVISDPSIFLNSMLNRANNAVFLENIVSSHQTVLLDVSHTPALPPLVQLRLLFQQSGFAAFIGGCGSLLALIVLLYPFPLSRLRGRKKSDVAVPNVTHDDISASVQRRHPEWDEERVNRVTDRLMKHRK